MNQMKRIFCVILTVCMTLALVACGGGSNSSSGDASKSAAVSSGAASSAAASQSSSTSEETPEDDGTVTYTVTVVDTEGNPIAGAMIQLCKDACVPSKTDDNGVATWNLAEDEYKVSFLAAPEGYAVEEAYHFDAGSYELTITLEAAQ